jgi:predicted GNAT superfamily acetyltransferase
LTALVNNEGLLLGAYDGDRLVGFTMGWLGTKDSEGARNAKSHLKLVSHMTGVLPQYHDQRVGYQLKLAQREWALSRGIDLVTWTYDPLESRNGNLNINLLGCTCKTYFKDYYGQMTDEVNRGIASDRFQVDWQIGSNHVKKRLKRSSSGATPDRKVNDLTKKGIQLINPARSDNDNLPTPIERVNGSKAKKVLVEIPPDFQSIRKINLDLAVEWRFHTRRIFEILFNSGYLIMDFVFQRGAFPRSFYLLQRQTDEN